ncbi:hypothetical protein KC360_g5501 [Hortaea werneckii]|nr:hypothetical protein KC361_g5886 [Hortaea werneckii]KAI6882807.1 hypothetical protein KC325_g5542 [Hortaea werneckii]KAI6991773.1 hypothetical protein KC359_g6069 [Hortaea werneckii]KAI7144362.1 hypothetical protein KC344_g5452 [Hortaea werneckii]KAI7172484.1 hypothetical protein KC360_g5501 [Hortaea werneckii]
MSARTKGFNPDQALLSRLDTLGGAKWGAIAQIARSSLAKMGSDGDEEDSARDQSGWREVFTPAAFSRKVTIYAGQPVNSEKMTNLNELYHNESKLLRDAQDITLSEMFQKDDDNYSTEKAERGKGTGKAKAVRFTDGDHLLLLRAYATMIREQVDELTRRRGSTSYSSRGGVANFVSHFAQTLLKDFFEICQRPNEAEVLMLTEACELEDEETTELWLVFDRSRIKGVSRAALAGPNGGPTNSMALSNATSAVSGEGVFAHADMFDPTGHFQISFDPNQSNGLTDRGGFDAFDPATNFGVDDMLPFDWDQFINEEGMF